MRKAFVLLLLLAVSTLFAMAQSVPVQLPTVTTEGNTNTEGISDINAQLIWLLAAAPVAQDSELETAARSTYQSIAFGNLNSADQASLSARLSDFRSSHDALAADYNKLIPTVSRENVWSEYRDFRVKVSELVAETVRALNDQFPDSAAQFSSKVREAKNTLALSAYRSSADPNYATNPSTAATGFTYIQGGLSSGPAASPAKNPALATIYTTAIIVGMVPGCPGKVVPNIHIGSSDAGADGPHTNPWEYVNFQRTVGPLSVRSGYTIVVGCELPAASNR